MGPISHICGVGVAGEYGEQGGPLWIDLTGQVPTGPVDMWQDWTGAARETAFKVSRSCSHGAVVTVRPADDAVVTDEAHAKDGKPVAVAIKMEPGIRAVDLMIDEPGRPSVDVSLTAPPPPH